MIHKDKNKISYERNLKKKKKASFYIVGYLLELCVRWGFFYKKFPYLVFRNLQKNSHFGPKNHFGNELAKMKRTTLDIVTLFEWGNELVEVPLAHLSWCAWGGWGEEEAQGKFQTTLGSYLSHKMVDEIDYFVPMPLNFFLMKNFAKTYVDGVVDDQIDYCVPMP
jgi:hypothetical protein